MENHLLTSAERAAIPANTSGERRPLVSQEDMLAARTIRRCSEGGDSRDGGKDCVSPSWSNLLPQVSIVG